MKRSFLDWEIGLSRRSASGLHPYLNCIKQVGFINSY